MAPCMQSGCICCYDACDCDACICCCTGQCDCLCIRYAECLACNAKPRVCGCRADESKGECCMLGLFCVELGLIQPTALCACARQVWCCYHVASFPFNKEYVSTPVCAVYFIQCCPNCGCCTPPPDCPAMMRLRGDAEPLPPVAGTPPMDRVPQPGASTTTTTEFQHPDGSKKIVTTIQNPDGSKSVTETIVAPPPPEGATPSAPPEVHVKVY